ncbi:MAG: cytochrome P450 [Ramlibacter sp.]
MNAPPIPPPVPDLEESAAGEEDPGAALDLPAPQQPSPANALEAVVHPDPYAWYARLRAQRALGFDAGLGLWVAATHEVVDAGLRHPLLHVRPSAEPVPRNLVGTHAGEVFGNLVRMNDGEFHARHKPAVKHAAGRFTLDQVGDAAIEAAQTLAPRGNANAFMTSLPVQVMARLLDVPLPQLEATTRWVDEFVQGLGAQASSQALACASEAARALMAQGQAQGLDEVAAANRIALMQQALDATAGLLGNTVLLLRQRPHLAPGATAPEWRAVVAEVARWDSPVHNTRRYAWADLELHGQFIAKGQGVLLLLASANRDAEFNRDPDVFDPSRADRRSMSFGAGLHACPGEAIALEIAAAALRTLTVTGQLEGLFGRHAGYRPLPNARIPVFET